MNRRYLLTTLYLLATYVVSAQEFTLGVRGGFNYYTIGDINSRGGSIQAGKPDELFSPQKELGTQFGAFLNIEFGKLFIRPEINFSTHKNRYDFPTKEAFWKRSRIDVPILLGYEIFDPITIYVGPGFNFFKDATLNGVQVTSYSDGGPDLEKTGVHLNFGIMVRAGRFGIDLRYEMNSKETEEELLDIIKSEYGVNLADLISYKPNIISLSIFIDILKTDKDDIGGFFSGLFKNNKCYCPY
ncbi:MAG: hypothetical protein DA407_07850 [Bacteroidetes bacterium]|nr:MAG: hypothetical protein DA407_07850 [Bacteroidota bacterium]